MMQRDIRVCSGAADISPHNCLDDVLCNVRINALDGGANLTDPVEVGTYIGNFIKPDFREVDFRSVILLHAAFNDFPFAGVTQFSITKVNFSLEEGVLFTYSTASDSELSPFSSSSSAVFSTI